MSRWTDTIAFPGISAGEIDAADLLPLADVSEAVGSRQRTVTAEALAAYVAGAGGGAVTVDSGDPTGTDDSDGGYAIGSLWFNETSGALFIATAVTVGAAVWEGANGIAAAIPQSFVIACSDETTDLATGTSVVTFRMPYAFTLTGVRASVTEAPTGSVLTVDINESGSTILSTKLTIDATEKTSTTAATPAVISDTALANDAEITVDIDGVGSTLPGKGLKVTLIGAPA
jgi:hypothetical protein